MRRIADALAYMRGPTGEVIFIGEKIPSIAWHLARAGVDVHPEKAIIKRRAIRDRPGQFAGMVDWVPVDSPDPPDLPEPVSAVGPVPDLQAMDDAIPWHIKTKFEGNFT